MKRWTGKRGHEGEAHSRRRFLKMGMAAALASLGQREALANARNAGLERGLAFYNLHTGEALRTVYWADGRYLPGSLAEINSILRDHRSDAIAPIDSRLLDLLYLLHATLEASQPFHIISGYRSPASNAGLALPGSGVAKGSLHMRGQAVDFRLPDRELSAVRSAGLALHGGGVGYYPDSNFVHLDVGRVRSW